MSQEAAVLHYSREQIIEKTKTASDATWNLVEQIAEALEPGMTESAARLMAKAIFKANGIEQLWHNPYINFGCNTIATFLEKPKQEQVLQEDDIAMIDIGPIVNGIEGDAGETVVFGDNPLFLDLKRQSERIFDAAADYWRQNQPTGIELYEYIHRLTREAGYVFHLNPAGHLIGSFPHKGWKQGLNTYPHCPEPGIWILEIQIRHPELSYGAFYESVLV